MRTSSFWLGNALLALAFVCLLFMPTLSQLAGVWAVVLWFGLVAVGVTLVWRGERGA